MTPRQRRSPATRSTVDWSIVEAGGLVPVVDQTVRSGVDLVTARTYAHPAVAGRTVVRLVPAALGEAEDLALEFLGFTTAVAPAPVGTGARRSIGFPEWALVHDPVNGRHALAMVKELARLARLAKTKPGAAKEGYDALADRLQRAVPHFLPTFWEQAARSYVEAENPKQAATCFSLAREAERVHALPIDEDRVADVHLEFALAGALPVKALTQYAEDLRARLAPDDAYRRYREVAVSRVAGGLAPSAGLLGEVTKLAKAAGLPAAEEVRSLLRELLGLAAVARAAPGFWQAARPHLVAVCRHDPSARLRLLAIRPDPPGWRTDITEEWIGLLDVTGASELLIGPSSTVDGIDAGAWLEAFLNQRRRMYGRSRSPALIALAERMVPRLLTEARELRPFGDDPWRADLDVLDALIAGGVSATGPDRAHLDVAAWLRDDAPGRRDLVAVAAADQLAGVWRRGLLQALRAHRDASAGVLAQLTAVPGARAGLAAWLSDVAAGSGTRTLAGLASLIDELSVMRSPNGVAVAPASARRVAATPVAPALARTLRAGLVAELCWLAYEDAVARFGPKAELRHAASWPYLIVFDESRAVVVGLDGVVLDHPLQIPPGARGPHDRIFNVCYVDGELLVVWGDYRRRQACWSGRPDEAFELPTGAWSGDSIDSPRALTLPAGGLTTGELPLRAGDRRLPQTWKVASDGAAFWRLEVRHPREGGPAWREYDPTTGAADRFSQPRFLADTPGESRPYESVLLPAGERLMGLRVWAEDGALAGSDVGGNEVRIAAGDSRRLRGIVVLPGSKRPAAVTDGRQAFGRPPPLALHEPDTGEPASLATIDAHTPPPPWWPAMIARDPAGSAGLRSLTDEQAAVLLGQPPGAYPAPAEERLRAAAARVRQILPEITDAVLIIRVAAEVVRAWEVAWALAEFADYADAAPATVGAPTELVSDLALRRGLDGLRLSSGTGGSYYMTAQPRDIAGEVEAVGRALADQSIDTFDQSDASQPGLPGFQNHEDDWSTVIGAEGALALRMLGPGLPDDERLALRVLLRAFARSPFIGTGGRVRVATLRTAGRPPRPGAVLRRGERVAVVVHAFSTWQESRRSFAAHVIDLDPDGAFDPIDWSALPREAVPPGGGGNDDLVVADVRRPSGWVDGGRLGDLLSRFESDGPPPWRGEAVARLVELTGMSRAEAALLLAGAPGLTSYESNYLPKATRQALGLSVVEARTARDALAALPRPALVAVLDAALPPDPADLWRTGPDVEPVASAWNLHIGRRASLDPDLRGEAATLAAGGQGSWQAKAAAPVVDLVAGGGGRDERDAEWFNQRHLGPYAITLAWLAYRLPADQVRSRLPDALIWIRAWLAHPSRTIALGLHGSDLAVSSPAVVSTPWPNTTDYWSYELVPARLSGPDDPALRLFPGSVELRAIRWLLSEACSELMAWTPPAGLAAGPSTQDPRLTVTSTVDDMASVLGLAVDAAAYYLQLLALPDPTDRNVARWTGWPAKRIKELGAVLVEAGLVVAAKRERAGRSVFLPGGWLNLKAPSLPVEAWKATAYGLGGDGVPPLSVLVPLRPVARLFTDAWERVLAGDRPRLEQLGSSGAGS